MNVSKHGRIWLVLRTNGRVCDLPPYRGARILHAQKGRPVRWTNDYDNRLHKPTPSRDRLRTQEILDCILGILMLIVLLAMGLALYALTAGMLGNTP